MVAYATVVPRSNVGAQRLVTDMGIVPLHEERNLQNRHFGIQPCGSRGEEKHIDKLPFPVESDGAPALP